MFVRTFILFTLFIAGFTATAQPPVENPTSEVPTIDPKNLSQPQLRALLEDQNQETGKDKNAELYKNNKNEKDSVVLDNIKGNAYTPNKTYGANVLLFSLYLTAD